MDDAMERICLVTVVYKNTGAEVEEAILKVPGGDFMIGELCDKLVEEGSPFRDLRGLGSAQLEVYRHSDNKGEPIDKLDYFDKTGFKERNNYPLVYVVANNGEQFLSSLPLLVYANHTHPVLYLPMFPLILLKYLILVLRCLVSAITPLFVIFQMNFSVSNSLLFSGNRLPQSCNQKNIRRVFCGWIVRRQLSG
jgi:hypothetical protein